MLCLYCIIILFAQRDFSSCLVLSVKKRRRKKKKKRSNRKWRFHGFDIRWERSLAPPLSSWEPVLSRPPLLDLFLGTFFSRSTKIQLLNINFFFSFFFFFFFFFLLLLFRLVKHSWRLCIWSNLLWGGGDCESWDVGGWWVCVGICSWWLFLADYMRCLVQLL